MGRTTLRQYKGDDVRVTTMLDLYAIPKDTPGWSEPGSAPGDVRADAVVEAMARRLGDRRLIPYVQVYEVEALVLAGLEALREVAPDRIPPESSAAFDRLVALSRTTPPETINDTPETAPPIRMSPMVHWTERRIEAHVKVCVLTLLLQRVAEHATGGAPGPCCGGCSTGCRSPSTAPILTDSLR